MFFCRCFRFRNARDGGFHFPRELFRVRAFALSAREPAPGFINGHDLLNVRAGFDGGDEQIVQPDVFAGIGFQERDAGAKLPRLAHAGAGFHAEALGLFAGGDAAGAVRHDGHDGDGTPAQFRPEQLLHGGEVAIEVNKEGVVRHKIKCSFEQYSQTCLSAIEKSFPQVI